MFPIGCRPEYEISLFAHFLASDVNLSSIPGPKFPYLYPNLNLAFSLTYFLLVGCIRMVVSSADNELLLPYPSITLLGLYHVVGAVQLAITPRWNQHDVLCNRFRLRLYQAYDIAAGVTVCPVRECACGRRRCFDTLLDRKKGRDETVPTEQSHILHFVLPSG